jgi:HKD family nuclease
MLIVQNEDSPAQIHNALLDLMRDGLERVRICSAYISLSGSELIFDGMRRSVGGDRIDQLPKTIVTSFDFGLTQPEALDFWRNKENCEVFVTNAPAIIEGRLNPTSSAFHSKFYVFDKGHNRIGSLVGSANLTNRGLTANSEMAWLETNHGDPALVERAWREAVACTTLLTNETYVAYTALRRRNPPEQSANEFQRLPPPLVRPINEYNAFSNANANLSRFQIFWVQSRGMQGGAGTQLELPRGSHRYFEARYRNYDFERVEHIAEPILVAGRRRWNDRPLTWHGDNAMERINLPSRAMGGFRYENSLILFRRLGNNRFELRVHEWDSDPARALVEASRRANLLFKVGRNSNRFAGLLNY